MGQHDSESMKKNDAAPKPRTDGRQIVGFSLPPSLASEVKMEAARRNISLRTLFGEMWELYNNKTAKKEGTDAS